MGLNFCHSWEGKGIELANLYNITSEDEGFPTPTELGPRGLKIGQDEEIVLEMVAFHKGYEDHFLVLPFYQQPSSLPSLEVLFRYQLPTLYIVMESWIQGTQSRVCPASSSALDPTPASSTYVPVLITRGLDVPLPWHFRSGEKIQK